jgi:hypothetical protein
MGRGTLWHLHRLLQCIKYIIHEFTRCFVLFCLTVLEIELKAWHMLRKHYDTWVTLPAFSFIFFQIGWPGTAILLCLSASQVSGITGMYTINFLFYLTHYMAIFSKIFIVTLEKEVAINLKPVFHWSN